MIVTTYGSEVVPIIRVYPEGETVEWVKSADIAEEEI
jgi:hypothetical protein